MEIWMAAGVRISHWWFTSSSCIWKYDNEISEIDEHFKKYVGQAKGGGRLVDGAGVTTSNALSLVIWYFYFVRPQTELPFCQNVIVLAAKMHTIISLSLYVSLSLPHSRCTLTSRRKMGCHSNLNVQVERIYTFLPTYPIFQSATKCTVSVFVYWWCSFVRFLHFVLCVCMVLSFYPNITK